MYLMYHVIRWRREIMARNKWWEEWMLVRGCHHTLCIVARKQNGQRRESALQNEKNVQVRE